VVSLKRPKYGVPPVRPVTAAKPRSATPNVKTATTVKPVGVPKPTKKGT